MSDQDNVTPMMRHYQEIKQQYPDDLVFYRLGDFYEMFFEDAKIVSAALDLTLTRRGTYNGEPIPMAGVPFHAADNYIARLLKQGFSVVICEQVGERKQGKSMERKVTRVITPGTVTDDDMLPERQDILIAALFQDANTFGFATLNLCSGKFATTEVADYKELKLFIDKLSPAEVLYPERFCDMTVLQNCLCVKARPIWSFDLQNSYTLLCQQFGTQSLIGFDIEKMPAAICAAGALLEYVKSTQNVNLEHIKGISRYESSSFLFLDKCAQKNLELFTSLNGESQGSLLHVLDQTCTPMGSRQLRNMLLNPLRDNNKLEERLDLVEAFMCFPMLDELEELFASVGDIERIVARIGVHAAKPRDLAKLRDSLALVPQIQDLLKSFKYDSAAIHIQEPTEQVDSSPLALPDHNGRLSLKQVQQILSNKADLLPDVDDLTDLLVRAIAEFPSLLLRDGGVIADGFNEQLDKERDLQNGAEQTLLAIEEREKARTGISTLKVRFNNVHGYYIEISKAAAENAPLDYVRRQTLKNAERFITPELKELEEHTLLAQARSLQIEKEIFDQIQNTLIERLEDLSSIAQQLASMDAIISLSQVAVQRNYVRPQLISQSSIQIKEGRHPVVESLSNSPFIANGVELNDKYSLAVISGPNMGGKSTFMRQTAIICIMARMGSFVPAKEAIIGDIDRIFTRIGASDDLASGRSTFMVEMEETATILNNATNKSLVIMDEVGRGTSGLEGAAIAEAIVQYLACDLPAKTMFATHYTEVTNLVENYPNAMNLCFSAKEYQGKIVFLYHAQPGRQSRSFGIEVAQLAGIPDKITKQAILFFQARTQEMNQVNQFSPSLFATVEMLDSISKDDPQIAHELNQLQTQVQSLQAENDLLKNKLSSSAQSLDPQHMAVLQELKACDCNSLTPLMALTLLNQLQTKLK